MTVKSRRIFLNNDQSDLNCVGYAIEVPNKVSSWTFGSLKLNINNESVELYEELEPFIDQLETMRLMISEAIRESKTQLKRFNKLKGID